MIARRVGIRAGLAACATSAALLACGESTPETAPAPAPEVPAPAPAPSPTPETPAAPRSVPSPAPSRPSEAVPPTPTPAEPSLSLEELGQRIKQTPAIGKFSKLALKNDLDDLVDGLRDYHAHRDGNVEDLHQRYEALVMKILALLENDEPELALALGRARERIWNRLLDPVEFAKLSA
jgi:hypothetical protein